MRSYSIYNGAVFAVLSLLINSVFNNMAAHAKCQASCNYHGYCNMNDKCICYRGLDGYPAFTGHLCEDKTCARWVDDLYRVLYCTVLYCAVL